MAKVEIYGFGIEENATDINGDIQQYVDFAGETEAEARGYVEMAGWTITSDEATIVTPQPAKYELPSYTEWCAQLGISI